MLLSIGLAACGFHLRGAPELPAELQVMHVRGSTTALRERFTAALGGAGVQVVGEPGEARAILDIVGEDRDRRLLYVDATTGKPRAYELVYALTFKLGRAGGDAILPAETVRLIRDYTFDPTAVLAKSEEEGVIFEDMREQAVQQVLRRLAAVARTAGRRDAGQP